MNRRNNDLLSAYRGFEQGPIRPPSEARSLLIRITRNCPWNHCTFCPIYKGRRFSLRPKAHVIEDIDAVYRHITLLRQAADKSGKIDRTVIADLMDQNKAGESPSFRAALTWFKKGMATIFLQDANSLIVRPRDLIEIIAHIKSYFPSARITSYARSHTIARISDKNLRLIQRAGLSRIHIGLESGSDKVLELTKKGSSKAQHIKAGRKVKMADIELSEYVMPGLGGTELSAIHALETADAINQINPDFVRLRTLALLQQTGLYEKYQQGIFQKCSDLAIAREVLLFIETLEGIDSTIKSDHMLNLFQDLEGTLPGDKSNMIHLLQDFLDMEPEKQCLYQVGRRLGIFGGTGDMTKPNRVHKVAQICSQNGITPENVDGVVHDLMRRFL